MGDDSPPDDEAAREAATDPRASILLQAPAGSGKTTVLVQRLLRLLAQADEPEEILAITFTRKAAAQMHARVLAALRGQTEVTSVQGARLQSYATAALQRSATRGWNLADDPGRLRIQTIDSFNFRLASQLPVAARAGGALIIADRPQQLYQRAARQSLLAAETDPDLATDVELLFERLDNQWKNVERLLAQMLERRGHWLRYVLEHDPDALCQRIQESLSNIVADHLAAATRLLGSAVQSATTVPGIDELEASPECLASWRRLAELTLTQKGEWRQPTGISRTLDEPAKDALRDCVRRLSSIPGARQTLVELQRIPEPQIRQGDALAIQSLARMLRVAAAYLQAEFAHEGRVDHTYVGGAARAALADAGEPTDLALRTGLSLRHILVDEFQDTSLAQFDLIEALTVGWEEGDGRTLFVVGDPMQSIYQFREAEVGLFLRARDQGIGPVRLLPLRLTRNFRSAPLLVEWVNSSFEKLFPDTDDLRDSAVSFTRSAPGALHSITGARVELRLAPHDDRAAESRTIAERIVELRRDDPRATIAVLVASRAHAAPIMSALETRGIDVIGVDLVPLRDLSIVRDMVALMRALSHLGDRTAWLAVLRAPWCGVSLPTLTSLSQRGDSHLLWEALWDEDRLSVCEPTERARLERVRDVLQAGLASRGSIPPAQWLEATWLRLGGADAYPASQLRHARALLTNLSDRAAAGEWSGTADFEALLAELFAQPQSDPGSNPVQVMTIHRAKGLEFDHVFLPSLDRGLGRSRDPLLRWVDLPRLEGASDLLMAPVPAIGTDVKGEVGRYLKRLVARRAAHEQTRLLYVATTRAKQTLYLSASPKLKPDGSCTPRAGTLLARLWPAVGPQFIPQDARALETDSPVALQLGHRLPGGWRPPNVEESSADWGRLPVARQSLAPPEFSWVGETSRHIGTVVHAVLEQFALAPGLPGASEIQAAAPMYAARLRRHGVPDAELSRATTFVVEALVRTVSDDFGRWIFSAEHRDACSELALTGVASGRLTSIVIDRSFVDRDGSRWVIDFKTSRHEGGGREAFLDEEVERYRPQLRAYVALARQLGSQPVRAALYFPLLGAFREVTS